MRKDFDVAYLKDQGEGRTNWVTIGAAFVDVKGRIDIVFDAMPIEQYWPSKRLTLFPKE